MRPKSEKSSDILMSRYADAADAVSANVDRWIECLQMLAVDADECSDEQKAAFAKVRKAMLDDFTHGIAERIRAHVWERWPQQYTSGETAADLIDPHFGKKREPRDP